MASLIGKAMHIADTGSQAIPYASDLGAAISRSAEKRAAKLATTTSSRTPNHSLLARARIGSTSGPMQGPAQYGPSGQMHGPSYYGSSGSTQGPLNRALFESQTSGSTAGLRRASLFGRQTHSAFRGFASKTDGSSSFAKPISSPPSLGANSVMGSIALAGAIGGGVGGYYQQGGIGGAARGAIGGAAIGAAIGLGGPHGFQQAANYGIKNNLVGSQAKNLVELGSDLNSSGARKALFASGGMLGGIAFSGGKDRRRGFNKNRGSHINR